MVHVAGTRRVVSLTIVAVAVIVVATALMLWLLRSREVRHAETETRSVARILAADVDETVKAVDLVLRDTRDKLRSDPDTRQRLTGRDVNDELTERLVSAPQIRSLFIVDAAGRFLNSTRGSPVRELPVAELPYLQAFLQPHPPEVFFGGLARGRLSQRWKIHLARCLLDTAEGCASVLVASMDSSYFERVFSQMQLDVDRRLALYLGDGTLFASLPASEEGAGRVPREMLAPGRLPPPGAPMTVFPYRDEDGVDYTFAVARTEHFPLFVGVANNDEVTLAEWQSYALPIAAGALLVSATIVTAGLVLFRQQRVDEALEAALGEASRRASSLVETMMEAIVTVDEQRRVIAFNPAAERMFGWRAEEMLGQPLDRLLPQDLRDRHDEHMTDFLASGAQRRAMSPLRQMHGVRHDGTRFPVESTISRATVDGRLHLTAALRDVTERERAKSRLQEANEQLRRLADALQDVREAEQLRIARELHDDLGQRLTGLRLDLSWLSDRLRKEGSGLAPELDSARSNLERTIEGVRRMWTELQPVDFDALGFADAVQAVVGDTARHGGVTFTLDMPASAMVGRGVVATTLFRVIQEAVHNVVRHAHATQGGVRLVASADSLLLTVTDNGAGFDPAAPAGKGLGLASMRERVRGLRGEFGVDSAPGQGTRLNVVVPLSVLVLEESPEPDEEPA